MTKFAKRIGSAVLAVGLVCGCILPASAAEAEEEARILQYETAEPVSAVVVDTEYADIIIQPGQTDKITVESAADAKGEYDYDFSVKDGVLSITVDLSQPEKAEVEPGKPFRAQQAIIKRDGTIFLYGNTVTVTLPDKLYDSIQAEFNHGDIQMRDVQSQTARLTTEHGNIVLSGAQPQELDLKIDHGDIVFDQAAVIQCKSETTHGDIHGTIAGSKSNYSTSTSVEYGDSNLRAQIGDGVHALIFNIEHGNVGVYFTA